MLQFTENKRKRDVKASEKESQDEPEKQVRKPAWMDKHTNKMSVSIEDVSRLRKLKKEEGETKIKGADYADRLKEYYQKVQSEHSMFDWAKPKEL